MPRYVGRASPLPTGPTFEVWDARRAEIAPGAGVMRALPTARRRTIGPWCFVDAFAAPADKRELLVNAHPHCGIQTVTWLTRGTMVHHDSIGSRHEVGPGTVGVMTSGHGIAHAEVSQGPSEPVEGLQMWVALPEAHRHMTPRYDPVGAPAAVTLPGATARVVIGTLSGTSSRAPSFHPMVGAELFLGPGAEAVIPLDPSFEHALYAWNATLQAEGHLLKPHQTAYLGNGREVLHLRGGPDGSRVFLFGGAPLGEAVLMWWNFVVRTHEELEQAVADWQARRRFGEVEGVDVERLDSPHLQTTPREPVAGG